METLPSQIFQRDDAPLDCTTSYSGDYYGFGVRLGVYFAWLGSYFANTLLPGEIAGTLDTNTIFLLTLLISLFQGSAKHTLFQVDGLVVLHLCSGFLFSSLSVWGYRTLHYQKYGSKAIKLFYGGMGTHIRLFLIFAICGYGAWFWHEGVDDGLNDADNPDCQVLYTWFFATWRVGGGINIWYQVVCLMCSVYYGTMCLVAGLALVYQLLTKGVSKWNEALSFQTGFTTTELKFIYNVMRVYNFFWIIFCCNIVEMTINRNHLLQVLAGNTSLVQPAQLLPLLVGVLSFVRTIYLVGREHGEEMVTMFRYDAEEAESALKKLRRILIHEGLKLLSPASYTTDEDGAHVAINRVNSGHNHAAARHPWYKRYSLGYLPWLGFFKFWRDPFHDKAVLPKTTEDVESPEDPKRSTIVSFESAEESPEPDNLIRAG